MKSECCATKEGRDITDHDSYSPDKGDTVFMLHNLTQHTILREFDSHTVSTTFVMPKAFRKNPIQFIYNFFKYNEHCGHDYDCCGCVTHGYVIKHRKLNRRDWNIHVQHYRNL